MQRNQTLSRTAPKSEQNREVEEIRHVQRFDGAITHKVIPKLGLNNSAATP
jgi:hypothetical protein